MFCSCRRNLRTSHARVSHMSRTLLTTLYISTNYTVTFDRLNNMILIYLRKLKIYLITFYLNLISSSKLIFYFSNLYESKKCNNYKYESKGSNIYSTTFDIILVKSSKLIKNNIVIICLTRKKKSNI